MNSILQIGLAGLLMVSSPLNSFLGSDQVAAVAVALEQPMLAPDIEQLITIKAREYGVSAAMARDIAYCESTNRQFTTNGEVLRGAKNPNDVGVFQINEEYHLDRSKQLGFDIHTTEGNIEYAMWLLKNEGGRHWHWSAKCWR